MRTPLILVAALLLAGTASAATSPTVDVDVGGDALVRVCVSPGESCGWATGTVIEVGRPEASANAAAVRGYCIGWYDEDDRICLGVSDRCIGFDAEWWHRCEGVPNPLSATQ